jgi:hypothetical protein
MLRKKLTLADWILIVANLVPVFGVWFLGWDPVEAFIVYAMETMIVGILTVGKLLLATFARGGDEWPANGKVTRQSGFLFIVFFILHFGIFALVQTTIFSQTAGITPPGSHTLHFFLKWYSYINTDIAYMLAAFVVSYLAKSFIPYIINEEYRTTPFMIIMFQPYGRILIQQFTVIIGSMFLTLGAGKVFVLIFSVAKIAFELYIDYDKMLNKTMENIKNKSTKQ